MDSFVLLQVKADDLIQPPREPAHGCFAGALSYVTPMPSTPQRLRGVLERLRNAKASPAALAGEALVERLRRARELADRALAERVLIATGHPRDFVRLLNQIITVQFTARVDANGVVSLHPNHIAGPPTRGQQTLVTVLRRRSADPAPTTIQFLHGSKVVTVGSYALSAVDLDDVAAFGIGAQLGVDASGKLAHELEEQLQKQARGRAFGGETRGAHGAGVARENEATGAKRGRTVRSWARS